MSSAPDSQTRLRIACYGYAQPDSGSVASAGFVILQEMLRRGHEIDFFGKRCFAYPTGLEKYSNFRYIEVEGIWERRFGQWYGLGPRLMRSLLSSLTAGQTHRNIPVAIAREHGHRHYEVLLFLGTWAFRKVPGLPAVSLVQGAYGSDARSVVRHARQIIKYEGYLRYAILRMYSAYRLTFGRPAHQHTEVVICGSSWSAGMLRKTLPAGTTIEVLPYPIDLERFRVVQRQSMERLPGPMELLWLGRAVPRKRIDLFLTAAEQLIEGGRDLRVRIIGGFGFTPKFCQMLETFRYPERLRWTPSIPREEVPQVLAKAAALVQPSEEEDFGSSVAEALACGTPVVVGPTNGTADYLGGGGRMFHDYETSSVADAIAEVLDGVAANSRDCSARARAAAEAAFDVRSVVDRLEQILRRARLRTPQTAPQAALQPVLR